ncbi:Na+/H+ antiporter [Microbacterium sp. 4R-513]|uniref:Na+/H+ antiporter n=1 Tax=Microbacterium sp. 4R-513 TaxID=2567934 RepID=UPI0013E1405D|nr:Na+/H+ antiporter [Microbacterium sp. 4R-513]QIG38118.1 Na+/H+ antiporter [Microbacterium sp. 4R-513]
MLALEAIVAIGVALVVSAVVAGRLRVPLALVQVVAGLLLGFIPALRDVQLPSEAVLLLFLPAILFAESLTTSMRESRRFVRVILINGTVLVLVTAFAVAGVGSLAGMPWAIALVMGAALAPTDATAVGNLARDLPLRQRTVLRTESLINDGTALVIYGLAVGVAVGSEVLTPLSVAWDLTVSYVGGVVIGLLVGLLGTYLRRIPNTLASNVGMIVTPFIAFLAAELVHASGVLAVVVCGLLMSWRGPRVARAEARDQVMSFWTLTTYILNGALFVLIGLELQVVVRDLESSDLGFGILLGVIVWLALIVVRLVFTFVVTGIIRTVDRRPYQRTLRAPTRALVLNAFAGYRGAVSLAAALAIPLTIGDGAPFPMRDLVVFVTAVVVVLTIAVQGPLLPALIRWAHLPTDDQQRDERRLAQTTAAQAALEALPQLAESLGIDDEVRERVATETEEHLALLAADGDSDEAQESAHTKEQYVRLRLAAMQVKRDAVLKLRDERRIDDTVVRALQAQLDLEEIRLTGREVE